MSDTKPSKHFSLPEPETRLEYRQDNKQPSSSLSGNEDINNDINKVGDGIKPFQTVKTYNQLWGKSVRTQDLEIC